jgi:hypothetical protein
MHSASSAVAEYLAALDAEAQAAAQFDGNGTDDGLTVGGGLIRTKPPKVICQTRNQPDRHATNACCLATGSTISSIFSMR